MTHNLALCCKHCGLWQHAMTKDLLKYVLKCKECCKHMSIKSEKGWNVRVYDLSKPRLHDYKESLIIAKLNEGRIMVGK